MKVTTLVFTIGLLLANLSSFSQTLWTNVADGIWYPDKVGIGTPDLMKPEILQLYQNGVTENTANASIRLTLDGLSDGCKRTSKIGISDGTPLFSDLSVAGDLVLQTDGLEDDLGCKGNVVLSARSLEGEIRFATWNGSNEMLRMKIQNNGFVGVGVEFPTERLDVSGNIKLSDPAPWGHRIYTGSNQRLLMCNNNSADDSYAWMEMWGEDGSPDKTGQMHIAGNEIKFLTNTNATADNNIGRVNMVIGSDGKVLIADGNANYSTSPAGYRLFVQDGIMTEKLMVTLEGSTHWPDYVFDEDYRLPEIDEVHEFIEDNHHLPGVPSAKEVKDGINVAEMDAALLKQIEELWLHVIELKKENEIINNELTQLKSDL